MFAVHLRTKKRLEFWQVEKGNDKPIWVSQAFTDGGFCWNAKSLSIQNVGGLLKLMVSLDDYLVFNGKYLKAVPKAKFAREYRID